MELLENVLWEKVHNDSEDSIGQKVYIKERCPMYRELMDKMDRRRD